MRTLVAVIVAFWAASVLGGCGGEPARSVVDAKRAFAKRAVREEIPIGTYGALRAGEIDLRTLDLLDVRFDLGDEMLGHAERVEIIVNPDRDTMLLRLSNITSVRPDGDGLGGDGAIVQMEQLTTDEWKLGYDVR